VNYIRRFQPGYKSLQEYIQLHGGLTDCKGIAIKYQRGFLNNASHAFDLLEFLFLQPINFENFSIQKAIYDAFSYDPTISGSFNFKGTPVTLLGLDDVSYTVFEIEISFLSFRIDISESGNTIKIYSRDKGTKRLKEDIGFTKTSLLDEYMLPIIDKALAAINNQQAEDNFLQAAVLNNNMIEIVNSI
jgi:hypothetical protein